MMSYVIKTKQGSLIVIDGGTAGDALYLLKYLKALGQDANRPVVEAWFLTHLHSDHGDAFAEIMAKFKSVVTVRNVYAHLPSHAVLDRLTGREKQEAEKLEQVITSLPEGMLHVVHTGESIRVDDITFDILHEPDETVTHNVLNNSSLVFRMKVDGQRCLFTGDIGRETSTRLVQQYGAALKSDILQMAHHGQNGATREFYQAVNPKICLWPTPDWLWTNRDGNGSYQTLEVRRWMQELKVERNIVSCFGTSYLVFPYGLETPRISTTPKSCMEQAWWKRRFEEKQALVKQGGWEIVLIGDSITHGWETVGSNVWNEVFAPYKVLNLGFSADRTEQVLWRMENGELDGYQPKLVFLLIGTNNTGLRPVEQENPEDTAAGIQAIIRTIQEKAPGAIIVLHPVFPRDENPKHFRRIRNNQVNQIIKKYADGQSVIFIDFNDKLNNLDGTLTSAIIKKDQLHLQTEGYEIWAESIQPTIKRVLESSESGVRP